jgi:hypothetical protein
MAILGSDGHAAITVKCYAGQWSRHQIALGVLQQARKLSRKHMGAVFAQAAGCSCGITLLQLIGHQTGVSANEEGIVHFNVPL